jgi:PAS domain S-box-containing protein
LILENELSDQKSLLKIITDNATVALFMMNEEGYCTFMNPAAEKMTGFSFEEIRLKPLHDVIHHTKPDGTFYPKCECPIDRALPENFDIRAHEDVFIRKDGTFYPVSCAASPIFKDGKPVSTVIEVRDLTQQKAFEKEIISKNEENEKLLSELKNSSEQLSLVLETIPSMVWTTNAKGEVDFINKRWEEFTGNPLETFKKHGWLEVISPEYRDRANLLWKISVETGKLFEIEYPILKSDGTYEWFLDRGLPLRDGNGKIFKWIGSCTNIQSQKNLDAKKDEFIGIASHELKTPLTSLKAYIQLLEQHFKDSNEETAKQYLQKTIGYIGKLDNLISDLLDVSKIQAGKIQFSKTTFSFNDFFYESTENFRLGCKTHAIVLEGHSKSEIAGDKARLEQVITNIMENAVKYSPGKNKITVTLTETEEEIIIAVKDYGIGIFEKEIQNIFERFYRVEENSKFQFTGLGLGLFISQEIIRRHNGSIKVESKEGEGSTFYINLPIEQK